MQFPPTYTSNLDSHRHCLSMQRRMPFDCWAWQLCTQVDGMRESPVCLHTNQRAQGVNRHEAQQMMTRNTGRTRNDCTIRSLASPARVIANTDCPNQQVDRLSTRAERQQFTSTMVVHTVSGQVLLPGYDENLRFLNPPTTTHQAMPRQCQSVFPNSPTTHQA